MFGIFNTGLNCTKEELGICALHALQFAMRLTQFSAATQLSFPPSPPGQRPNSPELPANERTSKAGGGGGGGEQLGRTNGLVILD